MTEDKEQVRYRKQMSRITDMEAGRHTHTHKKKRKNQPQQDKNKRNTKITARLIRN